jgi:S1-C subfamily serine protease
MKLFPFFISLSLLLSPLLLKAEILDSVVMVRAGNGQGTGFVAAEDGKHFLFTNTHVLMGGKPVICKTLSGTVIELGSLFVSNKRDLAKFEVNDFPGEGFTIASEMPEIHSEIQIFGNSDGAGVVTQLDGKVLGIGPELVEVDAAFIPGNSGSPILTPEQNVIGVATFLTRYADEEDWTKKDSRFNEVQTSV